MMIWKWLAIPVLAVFIVGCDSKNKDILGLGPYAEKPTCGPPGAEQIAVCYYALQMKKNTDETPPGWARGTPDRKALEESQKSIKIVKHLGNMPYWTYTFRVDSHSGDFKEGEIANFKSTPGKSTLTFIATDAWCDEAKAFILNDAKTNPNAPYEIPPEKIEQCPQLKTVWEGFKKAG
jgi:hypothetical protein